MGLEAATYNEARLARLAAEAAGDVRTWASGMTVAQGEIVTSPLDWEEYQRIAATGAGTTDPADDTTNYVARSYRRVTAFAGSATPANNNGSAMFEGATRATAALATGVRTQYLSLTGRGRLRFLGLAHRTSVARTRRVEIYVDGRTLFDATITYTNAATYYNLLAGSTSAGTAGSTLMPAYSANPTADIPFKRSLEAWVTLTANSDSAGNFTLDYIFEPEA